jgi:site-specific recombinase XerD
MSIKPTDDGQWMVDIRPNGKAGKRYRKKFNRKSEAKAYELWVMSKASEPDEWAKQPADRRRLSELLGNWWEVHGITLKNGKIERMHLLKTIAHIGDMPANALNKKLLLQLRTSRLAEGISPATINRDIYRLSGMFSTLIKLGEYRQANPVQELPPLKQADPEVIFLMPDQITALLAVLEGDERKVALICLSTGARWSEAAELDAMRVRMGRIHFFATKNGKNRVIPISSELEKFICTRRSGKLFKVDYENFREKLRATVPELPRGQATHVLRHTFASHFMMNGGNIITLRDILGHAKIEQTMIYAHFAPDFLQHAVTLNPLRGGLEAAEIGKSRQSITDASH